MTDLDSDCVDTDWKETVSEVSLDLWICRKFSCLPTEDRFKRMTDHQKVMMFYGYLVSPSDEEIRKNYLANTAITPILSEEDKADFKGVLGYSDEAIQRMEENLRAAGLM